MIIHQGKRYNQVRVLNPTPLDVTINGTIVADDAVSDVALTLVDQNGDDVSFTQAGTELEVELPQDLFWQLNFNGTDDVIFIPATATNVGTFTSGSGSNVGTVTVSTDGVTYIALPFPFTPVNGTTYYFKRSTATVNGVFTLIGTY